MTDLMFDLQLFAEEPEDVDTDDNGGDSQDAVDEPKTDDKTFTQSELDAIISKRLKRERDNWKDEVEKEKQKAKMEETDRLKAEKQEAEEKAQSALDRANKRLIAAEVKAVSTDLGVIDADAALALMAKESIEINEDGDVVGVRESIESLVEAKPYLKGSTKKGVGKSSNPGNESETTEMARLEQQYQDAKTLDQKLMIKRQMDDLKQ